VVARSEDTLTKLTAVEPISGLACDGASGVYIVEHDAPVVAVTPKRTQSEPPSARSRAASAQEKARKAMNPLLDQVTLVVYGWKSVEPGTLSWVFPSVTAAVAAARAMKNAVKWAIVAGKRENDSEDEALDEARASGAVLVEQAG
jgi:hypothetical protein